MRYTLGEVHPNNSNLFTVLDKGVTTKAYASKDVILKDEATIRGGTIRGGTIWSGTIEGGTIRGGTILGGTIRGGTIEGGTIRGGTIEGGTIRGGIIREGYINFFVATSEEDSTINIPDGKHIRIGCCEYTPEHWLKHYKAIAKDNDFSENMVDTYYQLILIAKGLIDKEG